MKQEMIDRQKAKAKAYMQSHDPKGECTYHNWKHVEHVMGALEKIMDANDLNDEHREDLMLAAIWHDCDFAAGPINHEARSALVAKENLTEEKLSEERLSRIERLIKSTDKSYAPKHDDERIIKDADLAHLGSPDYMDFYENLRKELNTCTAAEYSVSDWREKCLAFMKDTQYYTKAARKLYGEIKDENQAKLVTMTIEDLEPIEAKLSKAEKKRLKKKRKKAKKKGEPNYRADKGIETMFRVALKNHITLSRIADEKANTLISVNAIVLSIVLSALFPKLDTNPWLIYPGISLILVSIVTIILATLSTIPKTTHGEVSKDDVLSKRGNLLFFGNFHKMLLPDYEWGMNELMKDGAYLYGSLTRDLYFLGLVLNKKYNLLRYAYFAFVIGLMVSIGLFVWKLSVNASNLPIPEIIEQ